MEDMLWSDGNVIYSPTCVKNTMAFLPYGYSILGYVASKTNEQLYEVLSSHGSESILIGTYNHFRFCIYFFSILGDVWISCVLTDLR